MQRPRVHVVVGTRPEAVKLAPLVLAMRAEGSVEPVVVATGQHPEMVDQVLGDFGLEPDVRLVLDRRTGSQAELVSQVCSALGRVRVGAAGVVVEGATPPGRVGDAAGAGSDRREECDAASGTDLMAGHQEP